MVKLLMSWDIQSGNEAEYFQFVIQEFVPGLLRLGLQPTEVWFTAYGDCPQIQAEGLAADLAALGDGGSADWRGSSSGRRRRHPPGRRSRRAAGADGPVDRFAGRGAEPARSLAFGRRPAS